MTVRVSWGHVIRRLGMFCSSRTTEEEISEEELYRYTRYGGCTTPTILVWSSELTTSRCNEPKNLAMRYRKFRISTLVDAAVNAIGNGARSCKILFPSYLVKFDHEGAAV